ncbi:MAG: hypothetical protein Q9165_007712 [Trypethelium subeluteriae]
MKGSAFELAVMENDKQGREAISEKRRADLHDDEEQSHRNKHQRLGSLDDQWDLGCAQRDYGGLLSSIQDLPGGISGCNNGEEREFYDHHGAVRGASSVDGLEYLGIPRMRPEERNVTETNATSFCDYTNVQCGCKTGCINGRCACAKVGLGCRKGCKCKSCSNRFNALSILFGKEDVAATPCFARYLAKSKGAPGDLTSYETLEKLRCMLMGVEEGTSHADSHADPTKVDEFDEFIDRHLAEWAETWNRIKGSDDVEERKTHLRKLLCYAKIIGGKGIGSHSVAVAGLRHIVRGIVERVENVITGENGTVGTATNAHMAWASRVKGVVA